MESGVSVRQAAVGVDQLAGREPNQMARGPPWGGGENREDAHESSREDPFWKDFLSPRGIPPGLSGVL